MTSSTHPLAPDRPADDAIDPELVELPDPPKRERSFTIAVLLFTAAASLAMAFALRNDAAYALADERPIELGDIGAAAEARFVENAFAHGYAMLGAAHAIRYERPLVADSFRLMPVAGRPDVWAEVRVPAGAETNRYVPPNELRGRLVRFGTSGPKHRGLLAAVEGATGATVSDASWLIIDGDAPRSGRSAILLIAMFLAFATWSLAVVAKLVRRVS